MRLLAVLVLCSLCVNVSCADQVDDKTRARLVDKCGKLESRLNTFLIDQGFDVEIALDKNHPVRISASRQYKEEVYSVGTGRSPSQFKFLRDSLDLIYFANNRIIDLVYGKASPLFDQAPKPTWTKEKASEVALDFARSAVGDLASSTKLFLCEYRADRELPKYRMGNWIVVYRRVTDKGYLFMNDAITVQLVEQHGPSSMGVVLASRFEERDFEPIPQSEAEQKAIAGAKQILSWQPAKMGGWFESHQLDEASASIELWVVNPNHLTQCTSITEAAKQATLEARLAWVVKFKATSDQPKTSDHEISVWVDAENGKLLGGDFK